ncbi:2-phospho-L-lactate guanylyltransferase [Variovorax sp. PBL-E5]|uniref:2-phospho-L-lactate guanylyltransferase n=1 Tax=Variovorax sp. PBL-E5 TaxID=434014 RepID=UPI001315FF66|nr:2-phospho-L-lactate guanylyltransferase [Variovorax sp. PBL-E5]VTU45353.1 2-phospho-L-lactate guanylyltransferase [Variovorax sp. PBL-E5]
MKTVIAIPMKDTADAKTRLAPVLSPARRAHLALTLFDRAVDFFGASVPRAERVVITSSPSIATRARAAGAMVLSEGRAQGLNRAAAIALSWARANAFDRLVIVPADIPVWLFQEVEVLLTAMVERDVVIAAAHDEGTNALALNPARVGEFEFSYGIQSALKHEAVCLARGLSHETRRFPFLGHDIDTIEDCLVLSQSLLEAKVH